MYYINYMNTQASSKKSKLSAYKIFIWAWVTSPIWFAVLCIAVRIPGWLA